MKKFSKILLALVMCVTAMFALVGCKEPKLSATTNSTNGVISNGGSVVKYGGYVYFINGIKTNDGTGNESGKVVKGGIYKAKLDTDGNTVKTNKDGTPSEVSRVVSSLVGFEDGSLHIFGNYLYYTTPNNGKNNKGTVLYNQTCFYRYDLTTGASQKLYTTKQNSSDETVDYAYYKVDSKLFLLVYEKSQKTITSIEINSKLKTNVVANDVENVLFGENFGEVKNSANGSVAENYAYFTKAALETGGSRTGVRVFKIKADGTGEQLISEGESVSLLTVRADLLLFSLNKKIYAQKITTGKDTLSFENENAISLVSYDNIIFSEVVESENGIGLIVYENNTFRYLKLSNGSVDENGDNNRVIYSYNETDDDTDEVKATFVGTEGDYVVYTVSNVLYKLKFKNIGANEINLPEKLSTTTAEGAKGMLTAEILDGYVYYFNTKDNKTYMFRASMKTPGVNDIDEETGKRKVVGEASLFGVKE